jgi:hypothetical protein
MTSTDAPSRANPAERFTQVVDFPTPPLLLPTVMMHGPATFLPPVNFPVGHIFTREQICQRNAAPAARSIMRGEAAMRQPKRVTICAGGNIFLHAVHDPTMNRRRSDVRPDTRSDGAGTLAAQLFPQLIRRLSRHEKRGKKDSAGAGKPGSLTKIKRIKITAVIENTGKTP